MPQQIGEKLEEIPKEQLDGILQFFLAGIRKNDGTNYEPIIIHSFTEPCSCATDFYIQRSKHDFKINKW